MSTAEKQASIRFGRSELQPIERRLIVNGRPVTLGPRAFDLLVVLVERAGKLVSKHELLDRVWPNLVVEENNLQVQISALRKILGPGAIATIPGHGYRFTAELIEDQTAQTASSAAVVAKHNLPHQLTSFVGRTHELAEIKAPLAKTRLLTLVGFGGIGKTRLSLQAVVDIIDAYPDGVWFVELAPLVDARLVPQAIASVLGVREQAGRPVLQTLLEHVRNRSMLLLLDSCEHVLRAAAETAKQLLQSGAGLKIVATSRERLNVTGETVYTVGALAFPEPRADITLDALSGYDAVRLLVDRATAAQPAFRLTDQNATAVADICRRVDGIALALELAAARIRVLSPQKIAERLGDRFRLLTRGDSTGLPHRQTLRALIDWSYELLTEPQRAMLRRLAVFPGSFTLEAAEAVAAGGAIAEADVLDLLTDLIEKSLVVVDADGDRYRLLDTVREYAHERLVKSGEELLTTAQHLAFFLVLAEKLEVDGSAHLGLSLQRFDSERQNFLVAHASCGNVEDGALLGLRLAFALKRYWYHRGLLQLGHRVTKEALTRSGAEGRTLARCRVLIVAGFLAYPMGHYAEACGYLEEGLAIAREIGNDDRIAYALQLLGKMAYSQGDHTEARKRLEEALTVGRRLQQAGDRCDVLIGEVLMNLAEMSRLEGDLDTAEQLYEEALTFARVSRSPFDSAVNVLNLAAVSIIRGAGNRARERLIEAFPMVDQTGSRLLGRCLLEAAAGLAASCGEWRFAAQLSGAADAQNEYMGLHRERVDEAFLIPLITKARGALGVTAFAAAETAGRSLSYDAAIAEARAWLAECR